MSHTGSLVAFSEGIILDGEPGQSAIMPQTDTRPLALPDGSVVHTDPEIHSGVPVFVGTRVPVRTFLDYIEGGHGLDEFLDHFPSVRREQPIAFLRQAAHALLTQSK